MKHYPCDLCGEDSPIEIEVCRKYTGGQPIHVCSLCGLVYVTERRSTAEVAQSWGSIYNAGVYDPAWPAVQARLTYVAAHVRATVGVSGKKVLDIGCGNGALLRMLPEAKGRLGVDPGAPHQAMPNGFPTIFPLTSAEIAKERPGWADITLLTWTLENCAEPASVLADAYTLTADGGYVVVATGSRLMVPFKKRLSQYLSTNPQDTHPNRYSAKTLVGMFHMARCPEVHVNRHEDSDVLVVIGFKSHGRLQFSQMERPGEVIDFFNRWDREWP